MEELEGYRMRVTLGKRERLLQNLGNQVPAAFPCSPSVLTPGH